MSKPRLDVIVIGAGPYGLGAAAQLRRAGVNVYVVGAVMSFWKTHMPKGMWLRSPWAASHIGDPRSGLTLDAFESARGNRITRPIPLTDFIEYAHWFQQRAVPDIDTRKVSTVEASDQGFRVVLEDGEPLEANRVVVAAGISAFASRPGEFEGLPAELASHASDQDDLGRFAGRRVVVVGGGQSATESAALLGEAGALVELIMRAPRQRWVGRATRDGVLGRLLFDRTDVGPALVSHLVARPRLLRRLPASTQGEVARRSLAAGASLWLRPRLGGVTITAGKRVVRAGRANGHVRLELDDGTAREVDHVLLGTGYRVDIRRYDFLAPALVARVKCVGGYPVLGDGLESSVNGLHFLGAPGTVSFGPLLRFVSGTEFASRSLVRVVTRPRPRATDRGFERQLPEQPAG
jgi:hypothetical protein